MAYEDEIATVLEMIEEYGKAVVWKSLSVDVTDNPTEPWKPSADIEVEYDVFVVFIPVDRVGFESLRPIKTAPDVQGGNTIGYMGSYAFNPSNKDVIVDGSETYRPRNLTKIAPNGTPILYIFELDL